jgi:hypothetical protein
MTTSQLEKRLSAVEKEIEKLKAAPARGANHHPARVLEKVHGTFQNDAAFQEAVRLGRRWRKSLDAKPSRHGKTKRK